MKGDIPNLEYLPFDLPLLELDTFQVALHHTLIEFLSEFIKEIGAAVILAAFHVHIDIVAVLDFHTEDFGKGISQLLHTYFSVVDTVAGVKCVKQFNQIYRFACPTEFLGWFDGQSRKKPLHSHLQQVQLRVNDKE